MFKAWGPKEHGFHLAGFVHAFTEPGAQRSAPDTLKFQFYRTARSTDGTAVVSSGDAADSGLVVVQVELPKDGDVVAGMKQLIERYALGPEQQPTALHLLRILHKMRSAENREMLLRIRCLATAVLGKRTGLWLPSSPTLL